MNYILTQPDDSQDSLDVIKYLAVTGEFLFGVSLDGLRLRFVLFGSRANMFYDRNYHSFVGKVSCGR